MQLDQLVKKYKKNKSFNPGLAQEFETYLEGLDENTVATSYDDKDYLDLALLYGRYADFKGHKESKKISTSYLSLALTQGKGYKDKQVEDYLAYLEDEYRLSLRRINRKKTLKTGIIFISLILITFLTKFESAWLKTFYPYLGLAIFLSLLGVGYADQLIARFTSPNTYDAKLMAILEKNYEAY